MQSTFRIHGLKEGASDKISFGAAATRVFVRGVRLVDVHIMARWKWAKVPATASRR